MFFLIDMYSLKRVVCLAMKKKKKSVNIVLFWLKSIPQNYTAYLSRDLPDIILDKGTVEIVFIDPLSQYCHADERCCLRLTN